ncbi:MAG: hypothetical protein ACRD68_05000 [Pyrinomonadaceae bacterium]
MQARQRILTVLAPGVIIIGLAALSTRHTTRTQAQGDRPRARRGPHIRASLYGLHTLARGQTARFCAVNAVLASPPDRDRRAVVTSLAGGGAVGRSSCCRPSRRASTCKPEAPAHQ